MIVMTLLLVTALATATLTGMIEDDSTESEVRVSCESLEWLNIPTGFGSALAHQNLAYAPVFLRSKFPDLCGMMLSAAIVVTCHPTDRKSVAVTPRLLFTIGMRHLDLSAKGRGVTVTRGAVI
ncbi:hypothetical protein BLNAU_24950 [Blattamonas nauphoetae]|uniref:Uncharacterized protein n=1 Tax=Blattamonas nauphoetae TaxID=2049346 RepID=A0ABQ9WNT7_9EUKA|nr:hypothetical protein BLNAU_24950 [Blattamonas nauphoetae]